ncbi:MAG: efflux RND transporter periplasmic adaptor subunit [Muribaculaceae bacterium]|nr:efflux RND transporter periplasmic adaptor subunit [Muribaculaceae bacterium]
MKKEKFIAMLILILGLAGCKNQEAETKTAEPVKVKVQTMQHQMIQGANSFSGTIEEMTGTTLSFSVNGTLKRIQVAAGQKVAQGTLIAEINDVTFRNSHEMSAAMLNQAEDAYKRMKLLHDSNSLPEMQWVEVQNQLKQARASEQIARKSLNDCKLYAPFSGVISAKNVESGQNVLPGEAIVKLVTIGKVKIKIAVPETDIAKISIGQHTQIIVPAVDNRMFEGRIIEKGIAANPLSRSYEVKALVDNPTGVLMPGMVCEMSINSHSEQATFILPSTAIQLDEKNCYFVWLNVKGKAQHRYVHIGAGTNQGIIITSGLSAGDVVIVEGQQKVSENTEIEIEK